MQKNNTARKLRIRFPAYAAAAWLITAMLLLLICALIMSGNHGNGRTMAYLSAAVSYLSAFAAGAAAAKTSGMGRLLSGLSASVGLIIVLLTLGFIINGSELDADGVLSVVMFTMAGALSGSVFWPEKGGKGSHKHKKRLRTKG